MTGIDFFIFRWRFARLVAMGDRQPVRRVIVSHLPEPIVTGQFDMIKAGPNKLVAIGSDKDGVKVWPLSAERVMVHACARHFDRPSAG